MDKFARHKSLGKELSRSVRWIMRYGCVKKVVVGITDPAKHRYPLGYLRIMRHEAGGLKMNGYDSGCVTRLFIVVEPQHIKDFEKEVRKKFP
jgi:hypothetical protein